MGGLRPRQFANAELPGTMFICLEPRDRGRRNVTEVVERQLLVRLFQGDPERATTKNRREFVLQDRPRAKSGLTLLFAEASPALGLEPC